MKSQFIAGILLICVASCSKQQDLANPSHHLAADSEITDAQRLTTNNGSTNFQTIGTKNYITGTASNIFDRQSFDLYLPDLGYKGLVILIHGGAFVTDAIYSGQSVFFNFSPNNLVLALTNAGYGCAIMRYRLPIYSKTEGSQNSIRTSGEYFYNIMNDVHAMVNYWQNHYQDIDYTTKGVTNPKIALLGESSGGHTALMYAYENNSNSNIRTVISCYGPTDLTNTFPDEPFSYTRTDFKLFFPQINLIPFGNSSYLPLASELDLKNIGGFPTNGAYAIRAFDCMIGNQTSSFINSNADATAKARRLQFSPLNYFNTTTDPTWSPTKSPKLTKSSAKPTLLLHGKRDIFVKCNQSKLLAAKLGMSVTVQNNITFAETNDSEKTISVSGVIRHKVKLYGYLDHGWCYDPTPISIELTNPCIDNEQALLRRGQIYKDIIDWLGKQM